VKKVSLVFISLIVVTFTLHVGIVFSLTDDDHLPLDVMIPEGKAYDIANQEIYNTKSVTIFFLVDHDWVYANQLQNDLITVDQYQYNLDNQGWKTFTPISENIQYHYYPNGGKSVTEINSLKLINLSKGEHSIKIAAKMCPIIAKYSSIFGNTIDIGSTSAHSNMIFFTVGKLAPNTIPEFQLWVITPMFIVGCLVVAGLRRKMA